MSAERNQRFGWIKNFTLLMVVAVITGLASLVLAVLAALDGRWLSMSGSLATMVAMICLAPVIRQGRRAERESRQLLCER